MMDVSPLDSVTDAGWRSDQNGEDSMATATATAGEQAMVGDETDDAEHSELSGRLVVVDDIVTQSGLSLSVGCKETRLADVNVDVDVSVAPDAVADVRCLPFDSSMFDVVLFTEVLNLLPSATEQRALGELHRVLKPGGELVLTVPNDVSLYKALDVGRLYHGYRTYSAQALNELLTGSGFEVDLLFTAGNIASVFAYLWYCVVTVPLTMVRPHRERSPAPELLRRWAKGAYERYDATEETLDGRTIFVRAVKP